MYIGLPKASLSRVRLCRSTLLFDNTLGDTEIDNFYALSRLSLDKHDVARFEIAVNNAMFVGRERDHRKLE